MKTLVVSLLIALQLMLYGCDLRDVKDKTQADAPTKTSAHVPIAAPAKQEKFAHLTKDAESGNVEAQYQLGWMYDYDINLPIDATKAMGWYRKAADQGHARAQLRLGMMYANGEGEPPDVAKAIKLFRKSAAQGDALAQLRLGMMYHEGESIPKDAAKAVEWYQKSAAQRNSLAQYKLGWMYANGKGVRRDRILAYAWASLSANQGYGEGETLRDSIETTLTPADRVEGNRLSSNWQAGAVLRRETSETSHAVHTSTSTK